jgi:PAS domain S-box-containing protein
MTFIDVKTIFIVYIMSSALCAFVMASLWLQNRKRSPEIALWLVNFALQFIAILLITLRGVVPDLASIVLANTFIIGGTVILYVGLERYVGKESRQMHNYVMVIVFTLVHAYLTFVYPSLTLRNVNLSFGLLYISAQIFWLMLRRVEPEMRPATRATGIIFAIFSLVSLARIVVDLVGPQANDVFKSGLFDTMVILTWQILFIALTFALFLMVSRRLLTVLESELVERKQAEKKERLLLDSTAEAIYGIDLQGNCTFANPSCARMLGYASTEELLGKNMHNLIHHSYPDGRPMPVEVCRIYRAFRAGEEMHADDEVLWKKDGSSFPAEYWSYPQKVNDKVSGAVVTFIDISERKQAEENLRESEESIRAITNSAHDAITMIDNHGNISYWNPAAERILGYTREEAIGRNLHELITPERFLSAHLAAFPEFQKTGQGNAIGKTLELAARQKDGQEIDIALSLSAVNIKGAWHSVGILQDITERKKTEEKIHHMATHDSLTDLPTLKLAEDRLAMAMGLASRHKEKTAVMFIDLDGFKTVNDTLGPIRLPVSGEMSFCLLPPN